MKASGHHGTYLVPKLESNVPDTSYAVVWYDAAVVDLCKIMADIPQHLLDRSELFGEKGLMQGHHVGFAAKGRTLKAF